MDLLGVLAYGALAAFDRLAEDASEAPTLPDKVHVATMAAVQITHFETVRARLVELDTDVMVAMKPFHVPFNELRTPSRKTGWRAWYWPMSAMVSRPTSIVRWRHLSIRTLARWCTRCSPTKAMPTS